MLNYLSQLEVAEYFVWEKRLFIFPKFKSWNISFPFKLIGFCTNTFINCRLQNDKMSLSRFSTYFYIGQKIKRSHIKQCGNIFGPAREYMTSMWCMHANNCCMMSWRFMTSWRISDQWKLIWRSSLMILMRGL